MPMAVSQVPDQRFQPLENNRQPLTANSSRSKQSQTRQAKRQFSSDACKRSRGHENKNNFSGSGDHAMQTKALMTVVCTSQIHRHPIREISPQRTISRAVTPTIYREPPETDLTSIRELWDMVKQPAMSKPPQFTKPTVASRARNKHESQIPSPPVSLSLPSSRTASTTTSVPRNKLARVTDTDFRTAVLDRYGIIVRTKHDMRSPFEHFGTEQPPPAYSERISDWYREKQNKKDCHAWLSWNDDQAGRIAEQYRCMVVLNENEAKFSHRGKKYFCQEDDVVLPSSDARLNTTYFKLEWGPVPDDEILQSPPQINGPRMDQPFAFATKPDCTYWLTLCRMNPRYRNRVPTLTYALPHSKAVAPYFTIEFKKDDQDFKVAENQLAVSTALILYNRVRLRCERLRACKVPSKRWKMEDFRDIKHYGIAFNGSEFRLYQAQPIWLFDMEGIPAKEDLEVNDLWRGCRLECFQLLNATNNEDILEIQQWINEIHNWGLGKHSEQFVMDIKGILVSQEGGLHRVSMTPSEMKEWGVELE